MVKHYLKMAIRQILKNKVQYLLSIVGIAIGLFFPFLPPGYSSVPAILFPEYMVRYTYFFPTSHKD